MAIMKSLAVGQHGYVPAEQLWLTDPRVALYVEPAFYFVGENHRESSLLRIARTAEGYVLTIPPAGAHKLSVRQSFPAKLRRFVNLIEIKTLVVQESGFRPAIQFYFA